MGESRIKLTKRYPKVNMKTIVIFFVMITPVFAWAQSEDCWELYESYAASDAAKYHDILESLEAGNVDEAKEKLLSFQSTEVSVLEQMEKERGISKRSKAVIDMVRAYNKKSFK